MGRAFRALVWTGKEPHRAVVNPTNTALNQVSFRLASKRIDHELGLLVALRVPQSASKGQPLVMKLVVVSQAEKKSVVSDQEGQTMVLANPGLILDQLPGQFLRAIPVSRDLRENHRGEGEERLPLFTRHGPKQLSGAGAGGSK